MKIQRVLILGGCLLTVVGFVVLPLLVLAIPTLLVGLVMSLVNLRKDLACARERKAVQAVAVRELGAS